MAFWRTFTDKYKLIEGSDLYIKRRRDIIYRINKKKVIPKDTTLEKYNIELNDELYF